MISVILPLSENHNLNLLTLLSIKESLNVVPFEVLLGRREKSDSDVGALAEGNVRTIDLRGVEFGTSINRLASLSRSESSILVFIHPGILLLPLISKAIMAFIDKNPYDILGLRMSFLNNPITQKKQKFPSWSGMVCHKTAFKEIGGFSEYLPVIGADFLYSMESQKRGGSWLEIRDSCRIFNPYRVESDKVVKIHEELLVKRLPLLLSAKKMTPKILLDWPGVTITRLGPKK